MKKFFRSFYFAGQGIRYCFAHEQNFKIHLVAALAAILMAQFFNCSANEWMIILLSIGLVISMEMVNTAIERFCDVQQTDFHPQIKIIKDVAAGAVLLTAIAAAVCGAIIFIPKIIHLFNHSSISP
ncbi:diacylglycerol kinase family protein [Ferruginibacter sp. HRS2-29]|uniref:diacylglycerol kinase family protein n=1 Tax=Ferruginibacter sp. HRS2-29 TaxID=2487334 RepID=UPI0020CBDB9D|nr:diacylglycerol kinase family protein [Ferruginibacter sp. HRS2-29]MCP9751696.1 diacylglycerol kinase family protein [Ferruginibacter sp. HRS2-29]